MSPFMNQAVPPAAPPPTSTAEAGFRLIETRIVTKDCVAAAPLAALMAYWARLAEDDGLPSLADADPERLQVMPGRVHLVRVEADHRFRFLHYGATVTNPDARDMRGLTTADYVDQAFGRLVTTHYAEAVAMRQPVCRTVRAAVRSDVYAYERVVAPFGLDGDAVEFLVIATQREQVPADLLRHDPSPDPMTLREDLERTRRLARQITGTDSAVTLAGLATAAALHFSEATRLAGESR
jgi:hypothetical protein